MNLYKTPFLIWANYDIEEQENVNISMNYLSTLMLESTGMKLSPFNQFLLDIHKQIPVLTTNGYFGEDGSYYSLKDESSPYYESSESIRSSSTTICLTRKKGSRTFFD